MTAQHFAVKIVDAAKFTAIPSLTLDSEFNFQLKKLHIAIELSKFLHKMNILTK